MSTATKPRKSRPAPEPAAPIAAPPKPGRRTEVHTSLIDPNPWQARRDFNAEDLATLAEEIRAAGLLQPPVVRPVDQGRIYQLAFGERRLRACRDVLKWASIPVEVRELTDQEMRRLARAENAGRKDLNPIEQALELKAMLDAGDAAGPTELARVLKLSQGHVSNLIRLLDLPPEWQARVISREIPPTHARALLPYAKRGAVLAEVGKILKDHAKWNDDPVGTVEDFEDLVANAVGHVGRKLGGKVYDKKRGEQVPCFTPTEEQREALDVVTLEQSWGKEEYALNAKLWDKLQEEFAAAYATAKDAKAKGPAAAAKAGPVKLSAAEQKALDRQKAEHRKQMAAAFGRWLDEFAGDWARYLLAKQIDAGALQKDPNRLTGILLYLGAANNTWNNLTDVHERAVYLDAVAREYGIRPGKTTGSKYRGTTCDCWDAIAQTGDLPTVAAAWVRRMLWDDKQDAPNRSIPAADAVAIANAWGLDWHAAWRADQAGPLTEAYWNRHDKEALIAIGKELDTYLETSKPKGTLVRILMGLKEYPSRNNLPTELRDKFAGKAKGKQ